MGAAAPSSELFQVGARDEATLPIPFYCPPAILPFQDDLHDVSRGDIQLIGILGKRMKVHWAGRAILGGWGWALVGTPTPGNKCELVSQVAESSELHLASWSHRTRLLSGLGWPSETGRVWSVCGTQPPALPGLS